MPAPGAYTWDDLVKVDAHTAVKDYIDQGTGAGKIVLYTEADVVLATFTLSDPCGTVNGTTGQLTITPPSDVNASNSGTCTWARITDSDNNRVVDMPSEAGTAPVSGKIVLNTLSLVSGSPVSIVSATVG